MVVNWRVDTAELDDDNGRFDREFKLKECVGEWGRGW
jgi:hypothetical protein